MLGCVLLNLSVRVLNTSRFGGGLMPCHSVSSIGSPFLDAGVVLFWQPLNISRFKVSKMPTASLNCFLIAFDNLEEIIF